MSYIARKSLAICVQCQAMGKPKYGGLLPKLVERAVVILD